eukprot:7943292-Pyramimonas_sp.AAC.1
MPPDGRPPVCRLGVVSPPGAAWRDPLFDSFNGSKNTARIRKAERRSHSLPFTRGARTCLWQGHTCPPLTLPSSTLC